jgi:hypothetical protein
LGRFVALGDLVRFADGGFVPIALFQPLDQLALKQFHQFLFVFGFHSPEDTAVARLCHQIFMPFNVIWWSRVGYVPPEFRFGLVSRAIRLVSILFTARGGFVMGRLLRTKSLSATLFEFSQVRENA